MTNESEVLLDRLERNCQALGDGYKERVEYKIPVKYHDKATCTGGTCECPVKEESRTRMAKRPGLLEQLREYQQNRDTDRNPKAARGAPRVKKPKLHPELGGFLALDEITCDANMLLDRIFEEAGRDRTWLVERGGIASVMNGLPYQVQQFVEARPDLARDVLKATDKWIRQAKAALRVSVADAMFEGYVCENCGGALSVAWDNSTDVRCAGSPETPPCGHTYPMSEWVQLYERGKRDVR